MAKFRENLKKLRNKWDNRNNKDSESTELSTENTKSEVSSEGAKVQDSDVKNSVVPIVGSQEEGEGVLASEASKNNDFEELKTELEDEVKVNSSANSASETGDNVVVIYEEDDAPTSEDKTSSSTDSSDEDSSEDDNDSASTKQVNSGSTVCVQGAMFTCDCGIVPNQIQIMQNQKVYAQEKLVITDKEVQFSTPVQPFGTCTLNPNVNAGKPCMYAKGTWNPTSLYESNSTKIVTEDSEMYCTLFGKGTIKSIFHGQMMSVAPLDFAKFDINTCCMSLLALSPEPVTEKKPEVVFSVSNIYNKDTDTKSKKDGGTLKTRVGSSLEFSVNTSNAAADLKNASWGIINNETRKTELIKKTHPLTYFFPEGSYTIEGMGNSLSPKSVLKKYEKHIAGEKTSQPPFDRNCSFVVTAKHNSISKVCGPDFDNGSEKLYPKEVRDKKNIRYVRQNKELKLRVEFEFDYDNSYDVLRYDIKSGEEFLSRDLLYNPSDSISFTPQNAEKNYKIVLKLYEKRMDYIPDSPVDTYTVNLYCLYGRIVGMECDPNSEMVRPGTSIAFKLKLGEGVDPNGVELTKTQWRVNGKPERSVNTPTANKENENFADEDRSDSDNVISEDGNLVPINGANGDCGTWDSLNYIFNQEGEFIIEADFSNTGLRASDDTKSVTHRVIVKKQGITGITVRNICYKGVVYDFSTEKRYKDYVTGDGGQYYTVKPAGFIEKDLLPKRKLKFIKTGNVTIGSAIYNTEAPVTKPITIIEPEIEYWGFYDSQDRPISIIGRGKTFKIKGSIPAWENVSGAGDRKVCIKIFCGNKCLQLYTVDLDNYGQFLVDNIDLEKNIIANWSFMFGKDDRILTFVVSGNPDVPVKGLSTSNNGVTYNKSTLKVCSKFTIDGYFADKDGNRLTQVIKYGDDVKIHLQMVNASEDILKGKELYVYENKWGFDKVVFSNDEFKLDNDDQMDIDLSTDSEEINENDHKTSSPKLPRLFYFCVESIGTIYNDTIFSYPRTPGDLHDFDVNGAQNEIKATKGVGNSTVLSKARSYFLQLKIAKEVEQNEYANTIKALMPVVLGEELKKNKSSEPQGNGDGCPRCREEVEKLKDRILKIFPKAGENAQVFAQTYYDYERIFRLDSCWIKAVFFANLSVECNDENLKPKAEAGVYERENLEDTKPSKIFKGKWVKGKWQSDKNEKNKRIYKTKAIENKLDEIYAIKGDKKEKAIYSFMYANELGNGNPESEDGWNYRGGGYTQITGKTTYEAIGQILKAVGVDESDVGPNYKFTADKIEDSVKLGVLVSMAFFKFKHANMHKICDRVIPHKKIDFDKIEDYSDVERMEAAFKVVGGDVGTNGLVKLDNGKTVKFTKNHQGKKLYFKNKMYKVFDLEKCTCAKANVGTQGLVSFHIYSSGLIEKHIPKNIVDNNKYRYVYHTDSGESFEVATRIVKTALKLNGNEVIGESAFKEKNLEEVMKFKRDDKVDGDVMYVHYTDDTKSVKDYYYCKKKKTASSTVVNRKYKIFKDPDTQEYVQTELVRMDEMESGDEHNQHGLLYFYVPHKVFIYYRIKMSQTQRYYASPVHFAAFIGILAHCGNSKLNSIPDNFEPYTITSETITNSKTKKETIKETITYHDQYGRVGTGNTDIFGVGFPSQSHTNGMGFDISYNASTLADDNVLIEGAKRFGFRTRNINCGKGSGLVRDGAHPLGGHDDHIHLGPMNDYNGYRKDDVRDYTDSFGLTEVLNTVYEDEDRAENMRVEENKKAAQ